MTLGRPRGALRDDVAGELLVAVVDIYTAVFLDHDGQAQLQAMLLERGAARDLAWISLDPLVPLGTEAEHVEHRRVERVDGPRRVHPRPGPGTAPPGPELDAGRAAGESGQTPAASDSRARARPPAARRAERPLAMGKDRS